MHDLVGIEAMPLRRVVAARGRGSRRAGRGGRRADSRATPCRSVRSAESSSDSLSASGESNRHSSTRVACSENRAKLTPTPSQVAPSGYGVPGQTLIARFGTTPLGTAKNRRSLIAVGRSGRSACPSSGDRLSTSLSQWCRIGAERIPYAGRVIDPKASDQERAMQRLRRLARLFDSEFRLPGIGFRFGLDPILGLIPGIGDLSSPVIALLMIVQGARMRVSRVVLARMFLNALIDAGVGAIPNRRRRLRFRVEGQRLESGPARAPRRHWPRRDQRRLAVCRALCGAARRGGSATAGTSSGGLPIPPSTWAPLSEPGVEAAEARGIVAP